MIFRPCEGSRIFNIYYLVQRPVFAKSIYTCPCYQLLHTNLDVAFNDKNVEYYHVRSINGDDECRLGKKLCVDVTLRSCNLSLLYYNCVSTIVVSRTSLAV